MGVFQVYSVVGFHYLLINFKPSLYELCYLECAGVFHFAEMTVKLDVNHGEYYRRGKMY